MIKVLIFSLHGVLLYPHHIIYITPNFDIICCPSYFDNCLFSWEYLVHLFCTLELSLEIPSRFNTIVLKFAGYDGYIRRTNFVQFSFAVHNLLCSASVVFNQFTAPRKAGQNKLKAVAPT